jgi:hypothetical protein
LQHETRVGRRILLDQDASGVLHYIALRISSGSYMLNLAPVLSGCRRSRAFLPSSTSPDDLRPQLYQHQALTLQIDSVIILPSSIFAPEIQVLHPT